MKYILFALLFFQSIQINAQFDYSISLEEYEQARQSVFLLKNEAAKIPLSNTDAQELNYYAFGDDAAFYEQLNLYYPVKKLDGYAVSSNNRPRLIFIDLSFTEIPEKLHKEIESMIKTSKAITVVLGSENSFRTHPLNFSNCSHLIYTNDIGKLQQSLAAQLLFGGISAEARLENDLNETYKKGAGFQTGDSIRLSFAPPEYVGMDRAILEKGIDRIAQMAIDSAAFPGCQVLIVKDAKVVYHRTWGFHTFEQGRKVTQDNIYDFASVTKITSALPALMQLHGAGKFDLDAPFKKYFPKFDRSNKAELSLRSILAHQARLKPWIPYWRNTIKKNGKYKWKTFKRKKSRRFPIRITDQLFLHKNYKKKIYRAIKKSPLNEKTEYKYSGLSFYLWPEIVARMAGKDFESHLKETFYHKIGANTITYNPYRHFPLERIVPTENDTFFRMEQIHGTVHDEGAIMMGGVSANAGLFGTALDLAKLMQLYLNEGSYGGEQIIAAESVREFTRCQYCEAGNHRGLGFDKPLIEYDPQKSSVAKDAGPASYGHSGYTGTFTWVDPEHQLIYIFFSNRVYPTRDNRKIYQLNIRPDIHQVIYDSFLKENG